MKGREGKGAPPTDLLVCFPTRAHLTLMPKPICSPARPMEATGAKIHRHNRHMSRTSNRGGQASPLLWAKPKSMGSEIDDEPTSPKVTCAGQIKVRPKNSKNWQSVMEEIERIHGKNRSNNNNNNNKHTKKSWVEALGLKKDVMQFLTCLRGIRFDLRCFGSFHESVVTSDDEDEVEEEEEEYDEVVGDENDKLESMEVTDDCGSSRTVFSKWFMVLQENQEHGRFVNENQIDECKEGEDGFVTSSDIVTPPPNALLLMRCRSAPTKSWIEEKEEEESEEKRRKADLSREEEKKKTESLILKCYAPDFFKVSSDIAKETWVVGGAVDPLSRSRSWKR